MLLCIAIKLIFAASGLNWTSETSFVVINPQQCLLQYIKFGNGNYAIGLITQTKMGCLLVWSTLLCLILEPWFMLHITQVNRTRPKNDLQFIHGFVFPFDPAFNPGVGPLSCAKLWGKMLIVACAGRRLRNRGPSCSTWFRQTETRFYSCRHHTTHILLPPSSHFNTKSRWIRIIAR